MDTRRKFSREFKLEAVKMVKERGGCLKAGGSGFGSEIEKGMIYSPAHGDIGFTVPLIDAYLRRVMGYAAEML